MLQRNMGYFLIQTYIPTCLIVIISVSVELSRFIAIRFYIFLLRSSVDSILDENGCDVNSNITWCHLTAHSAHAP